MPLEQIRPSFQIYQPGRSRDTKQSGSSLTFDYDGDEEAEAHDTDQPLKLTRPQDMNLLKLGGVGGVTRSGSWGQNLSHREKTRDTFISSLTESPIQVADAIADDEEEATAAIDSNGNLVRTRSMGPDQQRKTALEHSRSVSIDVPFFDKSSAASYSAAAFSLRSLSSHRNSVSSASSSGGASSSRSTHITSHSPTAASETDSHGTKTSRRMSNVVSASTSSGSTNGTAQHADYFHSEAADRTQQIVSPPSSVDNHRVGPPGVNRVQSIGRGGREKMAEKDTLTVSPLQYHSPLVEDSTVISVDSPESVDLAQFTALTLSAAAATPDLATSFSSTSSFTPSAPRRHTGAFALRSQSALSQSGGALGSFWGGSGGRAAAREQALHSQSYENAPFSQLEARRAKNHSSAGLRESEATPPPPFDNRRQLTTLPTRRELTASTSADIFKHPKGPRMSEGGINRPPRLDTLAANAPTSTSALNAKMMGLGIDSDVKTPLRPHLIHTKTATNVLRTPTTEEWSRFLASQGVDPATVAASKAGRIGISSSRSSLSHRKHFADRSASKNFSSTSSSSMHSDYIAAAAAGLQHDKVRLTESALPVGNDSDGEELDQEVLQESIARMGITRSPPSQTDLSNYDEDVDSEGELGSSSYERMQALHEAISRPPSRRGSPPPLLEFERLSARIAATNAAEERQRIRRPTLESSAMTTVMGYPPSPIGERRSIDDFVILSDIGRGAYGLVKRVQLKDPTTGKGHGQDFCIKYIIKSRILADCWRRHKILGPIPIEIHVMDQLRRLHYKPSQIAPPWSVGELLSLKQQPLLPEQPMENIGHPSLCKMLDFFEDHEFYYMVMPCFGQGQDLFDYIEAQPHGLSSLQVRCIFGQVADGLQFLHHNNIVHRDIKDENVILDGNGHAQIIDFGSAAHVNKNGRLFDTFSGTLDYAAAEILKGEKYAGKEQDVWALGVVGYVLLCGDCPFWNGEEAIQGLQFNSRAYQVLQERCGAMVPSKHAAEDTEEVQKRESDRLGQSDGGGKIDDAADLIQRCLELEVAMRPSMELVCQHRFLIGSRGWYGPAGWRDAAFSAVAATTTNTSSAPRE